MASREDLRYIFPLEPDPRTALPDVGQPMGMGSAAGNWVGGPLDLEYAQANDPNYVGTGPGISPESLPYLQAAYRNQALNPPSGFGLSTPDDEAGGVPADPSSPVSQGGSSSSSNFPGLLYGIGLALGSASGGARGDFSLPTNHMNMVQQNQRVAEARKQQFMAQQQQLEESKRQHDMQMLERIIGSNLPSSTKMEQLKQLNTPQAQALAHGMKEADLANFKAFSQYIPKEVFERFAKGDLTPAEISGHLDMAKEEHKFNLKEGIKDKKLSEAMGLPAEQRTPYQRHLVEEQMAALENKKADTELKAAKAQEALNKPNDDKSTLGRMMQALYGVSWAQATPEQKRDVLDFQQQRELQIAEGRSRAAQQAALDIPDKPSATEREALAQDLTGLGRLDALTKMFNPEFIGRFRGTAGSVGEYFGLIGQDEATMRAEVATIKNQVIKMITGAQMSEPEARRIMAQLPDMTNSPEVFQARLVQTRENTLMLAQKRRDIMQQTGIDVSKVAPLPKSQPAMAAPLGTLTAEEFAVAKGLKEQGKTKAEIEAAIRQRRGQ